MGGEIAAAYGETEFILMPVLTGSIIFVADLVRHLPCACGSTWWRSPAIREPAPAVTGRGSSIPSRLTSPGSMSSSLTTFSIPGALLKTMHDLLTVQGARFGANLRPGARKSPKPGTSPPILSDSTSRMNSSSATDSTMTIITATCPISRFCTRMFWQSGNSSGGSITKCRPACYDTAMVRNAQLHAEPDPAGPQLTHRFADEATAPGYSGSLVGSRPRGNLYQDETILLLVKPSILFVFITSFRFVVVVLSLALLVVHLGLPISSKSIHGASLVVRSVADLGLTGMDKPHLHINRATDNHDQGHHQRGYFPGNATQNSADHPLQASRTPAFSGSGPSVSPPPPP